jgi:hypothetical protein
MSLHDVSVILDEGRVYVAWDGLDVDLGALPDRHGLIRVLEERFPNEISSCLDDASRMNEVQALVLM